MLEIFFRDIEVNKVSCVETSALLTHKVKVFEAIIFFCSVFKLVH